MGTFTISQTQTNKNLWLYPTADGCTIQLTPSGAANNYACVDEDRNASNEDTDYVFNLTPDVLYDLYETDDDLLDDTSSLGAINYVQIFARAKSNLYPQHADGVYKVILTTAPGECTDIHKSGNFDLTTGYITYNYIWTLDPSTATDWEWSSVTDLEIGVEKSSPTLVDYALTSIFRPNAVGDKTELLEYFPTEEVDNYECVDEATPNNGYDFVYTIRETNKEDLYGIPDHTTEGGVIANVAVFYRTIMEADTAGQAAAYIKTGGSEFQETLHNVSNQWTTYSHNWATNPDTTAAWTWADIDALQIGVQLSNSSGYIYCTQVYMVVSYVTDVNPEIRTTQVYAKINYNLNVECTLNKPLAVSVDYDANLKMLNFWSGNRAVYSIGRNRKTMVLTGMETGADACEKIECVKGIGKYGANITTSGMGSDFDDTFKILSFGWKKRTDAPLTFDWILELEYSNL